MPQPRKKKEPTKPVARTPGLEAEDRTRRARQTSIIIAASVIGLILIIVFISLYIGTAPFRRTIIIVDDATIRMDYFIDRTRLAGSDATSMLLNLANEQIIQIEAAKIGLEIFTEDIDRELRRAAAGEDGEISDSEYREWYRQQLNESKLSSSQFRDFVGMGLLIDRFHSLLAESVATIAPQVHAYDIIVGTYGEALSVVEKWEDGEDFHDLALEFSIDDSTRDSGGDLGWFPRGVLLPQYEYMIFDLDIGAISQPIATEEDLYIVFTVTEKDDARELDDNALLEVKSNALDLWLAQEIYNHTVSYHGLKNGFDSETAAWINWQIAKQ